MNILILTDPYPPQLYSISLMMQQLAIELTSRENEVTVITPWVKDNGSGKSSKVAKGLTIESGVHVVRVKTLPLHKVNFIIRGISQLILPYLFWQAIRKYCKRKVDVVIVYSPPLPLALLGGKIKNKFGAKFILNIQDIFPQSAIDLHIMRNNMLIKIFESLEERVYRDADKITSHTITSRDFLIREKNIPSDKVHYIPNWIEVGPYINQEISRPINFRSKLSIERKFIFLFAGVMGQSQGLELIIMAATTLKHMTEICFLFLGDGMEKDELVKLSKANYLENIIFHPFISQEDYAELLKEVDVGMISLSFKVKTPVIPGKILGYMAASKPIVAIINKESDGHKLIENAKCGYSIFSDASPDEIGELFLKFFNEREKLKTMGENGHKYVLSNFTKEICIDNLIGLIQ
jgi:colanic acid biosynthesis glycosyl transferase WcaI